MAFTISSDNQEIAQTGNDTITSATTITGITYRTVKGIRIFNFDNKRLHQAGVINISEGASFENVSYSTNGTHSQINLGTELADSTLYENNNGVPMLHFKQFEIVGNTEINVAITAYGQTVLFDGNGIFNLRLIAKHSRLYFAGRLDVLNNRSITENCRIISNQAHTVGYFVRSDILSFNNNIIVSTAYLSLSIGTINGTYNYKNIQLSTGQGLVRYGSSSIAVILNLTNVSSGIDYTLLELASNRNYTMYLSQEVEYKIENSADYSPIVGAKMILSGGGTVRHTLSNNEGIASLAYGYLISVITAGVENKTLHIGADNLLTVRTAHYNYLLSQPSAIDVRSSSKIISSSTVVTDTSISETDATIVGAYTTLDTAQKIYDAVALWEFNNNWQGEKIVTRDGNTISSNHSINIDETFTEVISFGSTTLNIKATNILANFVLPNTQRVIRTPNTNITGHIVDSEADSNFTILDTNYDIFKLYSNKADADLSTDTDGVDLAIETGQTFRYESATYGGNTYYFSFGSTSADGRSGGRAYTFPAGQQLNLRVSVLTTPTDLVLDAVHTGVSDINALAITNHTNTEEQSQVLLNLLKLIISIKSDEIEKVVPVSVHNEIPNYTLNSTIANKTETNGNIQINKTSGANSEFVLLFRDLEDESSDFDEYALFIRNSGTVAQKIRFKVSFHNSGEKQYEQIAEAELPVNGILQELRFVFHYIENLPVDEMQWTIYDMAVGSITIRAEGTFRRRFREHPVATTNDLNNISVSGGGGSGVSLAQIEASAILAKQTTLNEVLADTNELQNNQGNWLTHTETQNEFNAKLNAVSEAIKNTYKASNTGNASVDTNAIATAVWEFANRVLTDKEGYTITQDNINALFLALPQSTKELLGNNQALSDIKNAIIQQTL